MVCIGGRGIFSFFFFFSQKLRCTCKKIHRNLGTSLSVSHMKAVLLCGANGNGYSYSYYGMLIMGKAVWASSINSTQINEILDRGPLDIWM